VPSDAGDVSDAGNARNVHVGRVSGACGRRETRDVRLIPRGRRGKAASAAERPRPPAKSRPRLDARGRIGPPRAGGRRVAGARDAAQQRRPARVYSRPGGRRRPLRSIVLAACQLADKMAVLATPRAESAAPKPRRRAGGSAGCRRLRAVAAGAVLRAKSGPRGPHPPPALCFTSRAS